jgi:hypothetical protein
MATITFGSNNPNVAEDSHRNRLGGGLACHRHRS